MSWVQLGRRLDVVSPGESLLVWILVFHGGPVLSTPPYTFKSYKRSISTMCTSLIPRQKSVFFIGKVFCVDEEENHLIKKRLTGDLCLNGPWRSCLSKMDRYNVQLTIAIWTMTNSLNAVLRNVSKNSHEAFGSLMLISPLPSTR